MELEIYTRMGLLLAGLLLILFVNVDFTYLVSKLVFWKKSPVLNNDKDFMTIVNLWYQLKSMCDKNNYVEASNKLNEVFPLLNKGHENE
jgi:hypothetical protein